MDVDDAGVASVAVAPDAGLYPIAFGDAKADLVASPRELAVVLPTHAPINRCIRFAGLKVYGEGEKSLDKADLAQTACGGLVAHVDVPSDRMPRRSPPTQVARRHNGAYTNVRFSTRWPHRRAAHRFSPSLRCAKTLIQQHGNCKAYFERHKGRSGWKQALSSMFVG